jgi:hypothetical protein
LRRRAFWASGVGTRECGEERMALEMGLRYCKKNVELALAGWLERRGGHTLPSATKTCIARPPFGTTVA